MEGQRQLLKILKVLKRRGFDRGKSFTGAELKGLRHRFGIDLEPFAALLGINWLVLANAEKSDQALDGGIYTKLLALVRELPTKPVQEEPPVEQCATVMTEPLPALPPIAAKPATTGEAEPEAKKLPRLTASDKRIIASMKALDYSDPKLKTNDQRFQRFVTFYVEDRKVKRFHTLKKIKHMGIPAILREKVLEITGGTKEQFLANWRLYRHIRCGTKHKMALDSVIAGDVSAVSALMDYDEKGRRLRRVDEATKPKKKKSKKNTKKARRPSGVSSVKFSESGARLTPHTKKTSTSKAKAKEALKAAQVVQETVGAFVLRLSALKQEFSGDPRLVTLIEGITHSVAPAHTKLKQLVLRRGIKAKSK
jgi:DNA-binding transcriptional regulator YiaG